MSERKEQLIENLARAKATKDDLAALLRDADTALAEAETAAARSNSIDRSTSVTVALTADRLITVSRNMGMAFSYTYSTPLRTETT